MKKSQKRHLRELSSRCYEMEMSEALGALYQDFNNWKSGEISVWDLNEKVHQHHNGTARDLYKFYEYSKDPKIPVARGVAKGIIMMEDIQDDCHPLLEQLIEYYDKGPERHIDK